MKQKACFLGMILCVCVWASPSFAWYYAVGGSNGGDADASGFTLEIGKRDVVLFGRPFLVAGAVPFILHGDKHIPDGTHSEPVPHDDYISLGDKDEGTERGLLGKLGMEIKEYDAYVNLILGMTKVNTVNVAQSNPTGETYIQGSSDDLNAVYGIGISYFPVFMDGTVKMNFQLDIDNRRGITGYIGWCW